MWNLLLTSEINKTWFLPPLVLAISLVYCASRYEMTERILRRAARLFLTIMGFMGLVFLILVSLSIDW